ncbi:putative endonuclease [Christiangramia gaetbulicola]|uniref:Putative endonuclease n=1 Tax=Christiangramia gaetbulicola TaxID=703340 RepID=A0A2T6ACZ4_9FLAO|nr:GIY-YIG nuclease family protein [Christiangramia gaetbulicola]PTX41679.1 putative endonuclease [Christiangramia gaetbulicola]
MHFLYILYSQKLNRYYTGETPDPDIRLNLHNKHHFKNAFTNAADDWSIKLKFQTDSKENAVFLEIFIKRMKSKKFIEKVINDPSILNQVLEKRA